MDKKLLFQIHNYSVPEGENVDSCLDEIVHGLSNLIKKAPYDVLKDCIEAVCNIDRDVFLLLTDKGEENGVKLESVTGSHIGTRCQYKLRRASPESEKKIFQQLHKKKEDRGANNKNV